ncbi:hypothetical protein QYF36_026572 [Acer negundo]|nr:hypothetical protein QYF36_026572 [Acer negundo]
MEEDLTIEMRLITLNFRRKDEQFLIVHEHEDIVRKELARSKASQKNKGMHNQQRRQQNKQEEIEQKIPRKTTLHTRKTNSNTEQVVVVEDENRCLFILELGVRLRFGEERLSAIAYYDWDEKINVKAVFDAAIKAVLQPLKPKKQKKKLNICFVL